MAREQRQRCQSHRLESSKNRAQLLLIHLLRLLLIHHFLDDFQLAEHLIDEEARPASKTMTPWPSGKNKWSMCGMMFSTLMLGMSSKMF